MIIKDLFSNLTILASLLFMYSQLTKNKPLTRRSPLKRKIIIGVLGGLLGNILMQYSIHFENSIIDLRNIPAILLAFYAGWIPAFISMAFIVAGRFLIGVNAASFLAVPLLILPTIGSVYFSQSRFSRNTQLFLILTLNNLIFAIITSILIKNLKILIFLIPAYWVVSSLGGVIAFYIIDYLRSTQLLFEKYKNESSIDGLTGLNNYRTFDDTFNSIIKSINEKQEKLSLLYIDIDFFKKINDRYGHAQGDAVLKQLADILQSSTRSFDIVSRNGGEEFTVLLLDCPLEKAMEAAEKIRKAVEEFPFHLSGKRIHVTVSIGVSCYNETTYDVNTIIDDADQALYHAKNTGRNKVCIANKLYELKDVSGKVLLS